MTRYPTLRRALEDVRLSFRAKSPNTRKTYAMGLRTFAVFLEDSGIDPPEVTTDRLPPDCLEQFYLWLADRYGRDVTSTINTHMSAARSVLRYLARHDLAPQISLERSTEQVRAVASSSIYKAPRIDQNLALIVDFANNAPLPKPGDGNRDIRLRLLRDAALLNTAFCTGMRRQEIVSLNRRDVSDGRYSEAIIRGKGGKERVVFFDDETLGRIRRYLDERNDSFSPLFIRHHGVVKNPGRGGENLRISSQTLWSAVRRYAKAAGVDASTHDFRHFKATTLLNRGASLSEVQDILGHASPATTKLIYAHYEVAKLREAFRAYSLSASEAAERLGRRMANGV